MSNNAEQRQNENTRILGDDPNRALHELIRITKQLVECADRESQSLITNDHMQFAFTQQDKERLAEQYAQASEEFRTRLEDFRNVDKSLLDQLDKVQLELKEKTQSNNVLVEQLIKRASANTEGTLFTAQELGQRARFLPKAPAKEQNTKEGGS